MQNFQSFSFQKMEADGTKEAASILGSMNGALIGLGSLWLLLTLVCLAWEVFYWRPKQRSRIRGQCKVY